MDEDGRWVRMDMSDPWRLLTELAIDSVADGRQRQGHCRALCQDAFQNLEWLNVFIGQRFHSGVCVYAYAP